MENEAMNNADMMNLKKINVLIRQIESVLKNPEDFREAVLYWFEVEESEIDSELITQIVISESVKAIKNLSNGYQNFSAAFLKTLPHNYELPEALRTCLKVDNNNC